MNDCAEYRRALLADPRADDPQLRRHRDSCAECAGYSVQLARFEERLGRAMRLPLASGAAGLDGPDLGAPVRTPLGRARTSGSVHTRRRSRWFAVAASVLVAAVVAGGLWLAVPRASLADDVVAHMAGEPQAWNRTDVAVPPGRLAAVLRETGIRLLPGVGTVSYANICTFRGRLVPHLVVQTETGPVTVMVLSHESVRQRQRFDEQGYRGVIVPVSGHGSVAVLTRGAAANPDWIDRVAAQVLAAVEWRV
jgi:hypothetical protein